MTTNPIPDQAQRDLALDPAQSFIVQAPAGSGKTELLTQRYLTLLTHVQYPEEIIAITFTRKAAGEMKSRILKALHQARTEPQPQTPAQQKTWGLAHAVLEKDQKHSWGILMNPQRLRIQTIDSLCASLTRQMPILAEFGCQPEILDNAMPAYIKAAQTLLTQLEDHLPWSAAIAKLLQHLDNQQAIAENLLVQMLAKREQWLPHLAGANQETELRARLEQGLQMIMLEQLLNAHAAFQYFDPTQLLELGRYAANNLQAEGIADHTLLALLEPPSQLQATLEQTPFWQAVAHLLLTKENTWRRRIDKSIGFPAADSGHNKEEKARFKEYKERFKLCLDRLSDNDALRDHLQGIREAPAPYYQESQWEIIAALVQLLPIAAAQLRVVFQELGKVDFTEIAMAAATALGTPTEPTDLALHLDYRIRHLLIDEFQDTSAAQFRLLERLTAGWAEGDGHSLFLVGDPMQSIYRFREADVSLFLQAREQGIGQVRLKPLSLQVNFRSQQGVVDWVNQQFKTIFPQREDKTTGAVRYHPSVAAKANNPAAAIKFHSCQDDTDTLQRLLHIISQQRQQHPTDTIAILVNARSHLQAILPALKQANLPYQAIEIETFSHRAHVQDLLALTRALLHPADRIAWLAILRAPWCGLTLKDLHTLAPGNTDLTIWEQLQQNRAYLSKDGQQRLQLVYNVLHHSLAERFRAPLSAWVEGTWLALGGPACLEQASAIADAELFFSLLDHYSRGGDLADIELLEERLNQRYASTLSTENNPIQIMTIHKAKGLEFDTVIIPELHRATAHEDHQLLLWQERTNAWGQQNLILAPLRAKNQAHDTCYLYLRDIESKRRSHEMGRLLYVAATRARHSLHLLAEVHVVEQDIKRPAPGSLLGQFWDYAMTQMDPHLLEAQDAATPELTVDAAPTPNVITRLTSSWQHPTPLNPYVPSMNFNLTTRFPWQSPTPRHVGTLVHQLLQQITIQSIHHWQQQDVAHHHRVWRHQLLRLGTPTAEIGYALDLVSTAINNTLAATQHHWIFDRQQRDSHSEYELSYTAEDRVHKIIIDRTLIDSQDTRWIIDYKTSLCPHDNIQQFITEEQSRYNEQLETYARVMQQLEQRPIKLGLYFPLYASWVEWDQKTENRQQKTELEK